MSAKLGETKNIRVTRNINAEEDSKTRENTANAFHFGPEDDDLKSKRQVGDSSELLNWQQAVARHTPMSIPSVSLLILHCPR